MTSPPEGGCASPIGSLPANSQGDEPRDEEGPQGEHQNSDAPDLYGGVHPTVPNAELTVRS